MIGKYKAKIVDNGEWVFGSYVYKCFDGLKNIEHGISKPNCYPVEVDPETVCQYTGLQDKNGIEIYSGDTVEIPTLEIEYQTHTGDNIPNCSYTEPIDTGLIRHIEEVLLQEGMFCVDMKGGNCPLAYLVHNLWDMDSALDSLNMNKTYGLFDNDYSQARESLELISIEEGFESVKYMLSEISGVTVIGSIHNEK